jgi:hypothetical protein
MSKSPPKRSCAAGPTWSVTLTSSSGFKTSGGLILRTAHGTNQFPYHCSTIPARAEPSSIGCQLYVKKYLRAASITNKVSNSSAKRRGLHPDLHQISSPYSSATFASPPSPSRLRISTQIYHRSEGLLMAKNGRWARMSLIARHPVMTTDLI